MRRIWLLLSVTVLLAACGTAPQQQTARKPAASTTANRTYQPPPGFPNFVDHSVGREEISIQAMSLVGVPYRWGGNTPEAGFDCSGLVRYVVDRAASVNLPRTTADMSSRGESIEPDEIAPGDLIFFNTTGRPHSHVGIYVGKLRFVNAPSTGGIVRLDYLTNPYWAKRFDGIRRVASPKAAPAPFDAPTYIASPAPAPVRTPPAPANADAFEPPPSTLTAAQRQSQAAGATAPQPAAVVDASPDPIQATADAFEPPPPTSRAARQQARAAQAATEPDESTEAPVRAMRASTGSLAAPRPAQNDDPIARFATGTN
ncbi:NLP/P60 family lipoprotein [Caballeronia novacaledonica]|uniref:NLP/P60 family lipoprotein n=1 Tax=Caballeronia novacaledonica TaxID=1544861 RepID=A0A2U3I8D6_9BURK|nr:C40 family peptidase [Caballeronia novacaledonica]SPB16449.1 NLP/P60 family lipoprotein [Caballeronia novacaledonica]